MWTNATHFIDCPVGEIHIHFHGCGRFESTESDDETDFDEMPCMTIHDKELFMTFMKEYDWIALRIEETKNGDLFMYIELEDNHYGEPLFKLNPSKPVTGLFYIDVPEGIITFRVCESGPYQFTVEPEPDDTLFKQFISRYPDSFIYTIRKKNRLFLSVEPLDTCYGNPVFPLYIV